MKRTAPRRLPPLRLAAPPAKDVLRCTGCGHTIDAPCDCAKPYAYIPAAIAAARGIEANPDKSSRVIAEKVGVSRKTVDRERAKRPTGTNGPDEKRTARNGRQHPATKQNGHAASNGHDKPEDDHAKRYADLYNKINKAVKAYEDIARFEADGGDVWRIYVTPPPNDEASDEQSKQQSERVH